MSKEKKTKKVTKRDVYEMAKNLGVQTTHVVNVAKPVYKRRNKTKTELIREIQAAEDNIVCFKDDTMCNNESCLWFKECQK